MDEWVPPGWTKMAPKEVLECGDFPSQEARDKFSGEEAPTKMVTPLTVSYDAETDVLTINSLKYLGELFRHFERPDHEKMYRMVRKGDMVILVPIPETPMQARGREWDAAFDEANKAS